MIPWWWKAIAGVVVLGALVGVDTYRQHAAFERGVAQTRSEDAKVAEEQAAENLKKEQAHDKQLANALRSFDLVQAQLVVARRAQPIGHVMCRRAAPRADELSAGSRVSAVETGNPGLLPQPPAADPQPGPAFDPTDELVALAEHADEVLANCRYLHQAVHGVPTAPN